MIRIGCGRKFGLLKKQKIFYGVTNTRNGTLFRHESRKNQVGNQQKFFEPHIFSEILCKIADIHLLKLHNLSELKS
jgi:hypothetical protein